MRIVHLAGGGWITARPAPRGGGSTIIVTTCPSAVFDLLAELAARAPQPLTVILERDGDYPPIASLLAELARARAALAGGRERAAA